MKKIVFLLLSIFFLNIGYSQPKPKNVILLIGDGMGIAQTYAAYLANDKQLTMYTMPYVGLSITYCANKEVTDSGAGGTALAIGQKALYGSIGLDSLSNQHLSLLKIAKNQGKSTAIITSCDVTHATPASFVANASEPRLFVKSENKPNVAEPESERVKIIGKTSVGNPIFSVIGESMFPMNSRSPDVLKIVIAKIIATK